MIFTNPNQGNVIVEAIEKGCRHIDYASNFEEAWQVEMQKD